MQELLTLSEVARILRLHRGTVQRYVASGELPAAKMGRRWRVRAVDLEAFIKSRQPVPIEPPPPPGETR